MNDLRARLRATEKRKSYFASNATAPIIESEYDAPINPDGAEAADEIETLKHDLNRVMAREHQLLNELEAMKAQVGRNGNRQDGETRLGPKDEHAVGATSADAPNPSLRATKIAERLGK